MLYQVQVSGGDNWSSGPYLYDGAGNVKRIGSQRYKYDRMSRLVEGEVLVGAQEKTQSLAYDAFGNILSLNTDGSFQSTPTSNSTNRLNNAEYDAGGNLTDITLSGETYEYTYDPLNMMKYLQSDTGQARVFLYDADDERIMTFDCAFVDGDCAVPAQLTTKIRGLDGKVLRIYNQPFGGTWNWERDYVYRDGQLLASVEPTAGGGEDTVHFHLDHLGSPRQITDEAGAQAAFHTYYPFGGEATDASQDDVELKFTGHERDENGGGAGVLDYMHRRYFSPTLGRFLAVDPADGASLNRPQGWNRLAYSMNNPLRFIDPDGREEEEPKSTFGKLLVDIQKALDTYVGFNFLGPVDYRDGKFRQVLPTKTEAAALLGAAVAITIVQRSALSVDAEKALSEIESGADRPNVRNPNSFENDGRGGSEVLPTTDSEGNPIRYTEYTVNPREPGQALDGKRFVIGDDGSIYYTEDHFEHFHKLEDDTVEIE